MVIFIKLLIEKEIDNMGLKKKDYTMRGIAMAPLAFLVGGAPAAVASVAAGYALGDAREKEVKRRMEEGERQRKREMEEYQAKQKADRERCEDYATTHERYFQGSNYNDIEDRLRGYFKDKADVWDMDTAIYLHLYTPDYWYQENKCQIGVLKKLYEPGCNERDFINLCSDDFIHQYELYKSVDTANVKLHVYKSAGGGCAPVMKVTLQNGVIKRFSCLPHHNLKPPMKY